MSTALKLYEPMPFQNEFHMSQERQVVIQKANRAGGTLALCVEVARAVTGTDPLAKYPKDNGIAVVLGYNERHSCIFHRYLFEPAPFAGAADALIPKSHVKSIAWRNRQERVFSRVAFTNGWQLIAVNSAGEHHQLAGFDANLIAIDEDLACSGWYEEALGRLATRDGLLRWVSSPNSTADFAQCRATAKVIRASLLDNRFLDHQVIERCADHWKSRGDDVYRRRVLGEFPAETSP